MAMQVTVEDLSSVKKRLRIEIAQDQVVRELDSAYKQLKKTAKIKGFRPGKVPRSVLERMFKKDVHADVTSRLIQESFMDALKETELQVVGNPQVDPPELVVDSPYAYDATVEVKPSIESVDFKGLNLKKRRYDVSEDEIDIQLKALQKNFARLKPIAEDRAVKEGDHVIVHYEGLKGGKPFTETQRTENFQLKIGDGKIHSDFDRGLVGMRPGEDKEITVEFPADYANDALAGERIDFQVSLLEIREEELPPIDDALAKRAGNYKNLDEIRERIRQNLKEGYEKRIEQELNEQIFKNLIEKTAFDVPETLVDQELNSILDDAERSFAYRNTSLQEMGLTRESLAEKYRGTAEKQVRRHLILDKIISQEQLDLTEAELDDGFQQMAAALNQPMEAVKSYYHHDSEKLEYFKHALLEKKAVKLIIESGAVETVEAPNPADTETAGADD